MAVLLADQVASAIGQPASVRVGTIVSVFPPVISIQGATFTNVGFVGTYLPTAGDTVSVLGQSPTSGSDPASWLVLGSVTAQGMRSTLVSCNATTNLPLVDTDIPGTTFAFTTSAVSTQIRVWTQVDYEVVGATISTAVVRPFLDGVAINAQSQVVFEMPVAAATGRWVLSGFTQFNVAAGAHSLKLSGITAVGIANQIRVVISTTSMMVDIYG